jgi:hypothetical protein
LGAACGFEFWKFSNERIGLLRKLIFIREEVRFLDGCGTRGLCDGAGCFWDWLAGSGWVREDSCGSGGGMCELLWMGGL